MLMPMAPLPSPLPLSQLPALPQCNLAKGLLQSSHKTQLVATPPMDHRRQQKRQTKQMVMVMVMVMLVLMLAATWTQQMMLGSRVAA